MTRTRAPRCHGAHRQNDSVPVDVNMSTSWSGTCSKLQLPSGLRARTAGPVTVPVPLPVALANCPVPPAISPVWWIVAVATQLRGLTERLKSRFVLTCGLPNTIRAVTCVSRSNAGW